MMSILGEYFKSIYQPVSCVSWWSVERSPNWTDLPVDILETILARMSTKDVLSSRLVCRSWRDPAGRQIRVVDIPAHMFKRKDVNVAKRLVSVFPHIDTLVSLIIKDTINVLSRGISAQNMRQHEVISDTCGLCRLCPLSALRLISLHGLVGELLPIRHTLQRLELHSFPVHPLSAMRMLQMQQRSERRNRACASSRYGGNIREDALWRSLPSSWPGRAWVLHPLGNLYRLSSLELQLVSVNDNGCRSNQSVGSTARHNEVNGLNRERETGNCSDDNSSTACQTTYSGIRKCLAAGQGVLLASLSSLRHLRLQELSVRLLDSFEDEVPEGGDPLETGSSEDSSEADDGDLAGLSFQDNLFGNSISASHTPHQNVVFDCVGNEDDGFSGIEIDHGNLDEPQAPTFESLFLPASTLGPSGTVQGEEHPKGQSPEFFSHAKLKFHQSIFGIPPSEPSSDSVSSCIQRVTIMSIAQAVCLLPSLTHLRVENCRLASLDLVSICRSLRGLHELSLKGSVCMSHRGIDALSALTSLTKMCLDGVRLVYRSHDAEDCPELMMNHLYATLGAIKGFKSLGFKLDPLNGTHYMHSAFLLGLYQEGALEEAEEVGMTSEGRWRPSSSSSSSDDRPISSPGDGSDTNDDGTSSHRLCDNGVHSSVKVIPQLRSCLRSLDLSQVVFDSDYTLMMLGQISNLTSLKVEYRTWPLSLAQDDLSLLAPLTALRTLRLSCCDGEGEADPGLLALTSRALAVLVRSCREMRVFQYSGPIVLDDPGCPELSLWTSLTELDLCHQPDGMVPFLLDLDIPSCLPKSLRSLSLRRVSLSTSAAAQISSHIPNLTSLSLSEFYLSWEHLLALGGGCSAESADQFQRQLTVLSICSSFSHFNTRASLPANPSEPCYSWNKAPVNVPNAALRCLGKMRNLEYLLIGLPPMPSSANESINLAYLAPALSCLKVFSLQTPTNSPAYLDINDLLRASLAQTNI